jgi:hypothetical protein
MLSETWGSYPLGYYRSPYLNKIINKNDELECVFRFYKKHNLHQNYPLNRIIFMKDQNNFVGFFALNIVNGNLESHIGGILKPFRKGKYFLDMLTYIKSFCVNNNLPYFLFGARNENPIVQKIFHEVGFAPIGTENVFHILPFLSHSKLVPLAINIKYDNLLCIDKIIFSIYLNKLNDKIIFYSKSINTSWHITPVIEREYLCKISLPVLFNDIYSGTVVVKYYDSKTLVGITYIDFDSFS